MSYIEDANIAGFGEYDLNALDTPSLYWTNGAIENAIPNLISVSEDHEIVRWTLSLLQEDGSFDDLTENAPPLIETRWALRVLRMLGYDFKNLVSTRGFLAKEIESLDFSHLVVDSELIDELNHAHLLALCGSEFEQASHPLSEASLSLLAESVAGVSELIDPLAASSTSWVWTEGHRASWGYVLTLARIAPELLSPHGFTFLERHLSQIDKLPASYLSCAFLRDLLAACSSAFDWDAVPEHIQTSALGLIETKILPLIAEEIGGIGNAGYDGRFSLEIQRTVPLLQLYSLLKEAYPFSSTLASVLTRLRISSGWIRQVQIIRDPMSSFIALWLAGSHGWSSFDSSKLQEYFQLVINSPASSPADVLYAALGWETLGCSKAQLRADLLARLNAATQGWYESRGAESVNLVYHFDLFEFGRSLLGGFLGARQTAILASPAPYSWLVHARELWMLDQILGTETVSSDTWIEILLAMEAPTGGFMFRSGLSEADGAVSALPATFMALEWLDWIQQPVLVNREALRDFVDSCYRTPGYLIAPPEVLSHYGEPEDVNMLYSYYGYRVLHFLETGEI